MLFHHAQGDSHALGHFDLGQAVELVQDERFAPPRRQLGQRGRQVAEALLLFETLARPGRLAFQRGGFVVRRRPVDILAAALLPAPMVAQQVAGDLEKKCARLLDRLPARPFQPLGESILGEVGGVRRTAQVLAQEAQQLAMERLIGMRDGTTEALIHPCILRRRPRAVDPLQHLASPLPSDTEVPCKYANDNTYHFTR